MKSKFSLILILGAVIASGCATSESGSKESSAAKSAAEQKKDEQWRNQKEKNPEVGMTKEQVSDLYGKPDNVQISSDGEVWSYNVNAGQAWIPFNYGYRPKFRVITFTKEGKLAQWSMTQ